MEGHTQRPLLNRVKFNTGLPNIKKLTKDICGLVKPNAMLTILFINVICGLGCASQSSIAPQSVPQKTEPVSEYRLVEGDTVDLKFYYEPALNETVIIRPDGKIALQVIGEIQATGLTPSELDHVITEKYAKILRDPEVAVIVKSFSAHKVYVGGDVKAPGEIPLIGKMTSVQAIVRAGGANSTANLKSVIIIRKGEAEKPNVFKTDVNKPLSGDESYREFLLEPHDVVFVPKSTITKIDQFVSQYIQQLIPITLTTGFTWVKHLGKTRSVTEIDY